MSDDVIVRAAELENKCKSLHEQLTLLIDGVTIGDAQKELVRAWRDNLDVVRDLTFCSLKLVFLAAVGRGKSTLVAAAAGLRLDDAESANPSRWSVLPVKAGRTTLGETRIDFSGTHDIVLKVVPMSRNALEREIRVFAQDQFDAVHTRKSSGKTEGQPGEELAKLLKNWLAPNAAFSVSEATKVLREEAERAESSGALEKQWINRIDFDVRCMPREQSFAATPEGLKSLKDMLANLMTGKLATAPVPAVTHIIVPPGKLAFRVGELIDTQGIDDGANAWIKGRADILQRIHDPGSLLVLCSQFEDAPDPVSLSVLQAIQEIGGPTALQHHAVRLIVIDKRNKDEEDPQEFAEALQERLQQCRAKIRRSGIELPDEAVIAIDVRSDDGVQALRSELSAMARDGRSWRLGELKEALKNTEAAMVSVRDELFLVRAREVDLRLWWEWDTQVISSVKPGLDGFSALSKALPEYDDYYWSQMHASVRRRGHYYRFDLAKLGAQFAADDAVSGYNAALTRVRVEAARIARDDEALASHAALRINDFAQAIRRNHQAIKEEWERVLTEYFASARSDDLWTWCVNRWGGGKGYLAEVIQRIGKESEHAQLRIAITDTIENHLPQRPGLFSLRQIRLTNFRGTEHSAHTLGPATVFIGDNGMGKTCLLEAIAATIGMFLPGVGAGSAPELAESDVREVLKRIGGLADRQPQLPMEVEAEGIIEGHSLTWSRKISSLPILTNGTSDDAFQIKARHAGDDIRRQSMRQLPVLIYYGTQRLWPPNIAPKSDVGSNRLDGYRDCLDPASTQSNLLSWMKKYTLVELQRKSPVPQLQAIRTAVTRCIEGAKDFFYDLDLEELVVEMADGRCSRFRTLSDGYRNVVAMVADIAWRAAVLNPQLLGFAPEYAEGVVLIDEIDLHLHPKWQRRVLADLQRVFPRLQFIATTHSPFIVQSLEPGQLVNLDENAPDVPYANESPEDIVENLMGVSLPQRSDRRQREYEVAKRYYDLLEKVPPADPVELAQLKATLDEMIAPYADNQAFVAFLERQKLLAEAKRA